MDHIKLQAQLEASISKYAGSVQELIHDSDIEPETDNEHLLMYLLDDLCRYNFYALSEFRDILVTLEKNRGQ